MQFLYFLATLLVPISTVSALKLGPVAPASLPKGTVGTYKASVSRPPASPAPGAVSRPASRPASASRPKLAKRAPYDVADSLLRLPNALYVDVGTLGTVTITTELTWRDGKNVIGSSGFGACHAVVIKVGHNVAVGHIMTWTPTLQSQVQAWAQFAKDNGGRAWIWVPQVNSADEQPTLVSSIITALGGLTTKKVVRERSQNVEASKITAMAVTTTQIIMGMYEETL